MQFGLSLNKKGQDAGPVAVLIFIITLMIILYVLFIPEDVRNDLLDGDDPFSDYTGDNDDRDRDGRDRQDADVLLDESPGQLTPEGRDNFEYTMPSITIYEETEAQEIRKENPFVVKNGWFSKRTKNVTFAIDDIDLVNNLLLSFNAPQHEGELTIRLNGDRIFESPVTSYSVDAITLPKELLVEGNNLLVFSTSSVGIRFWASNDYSIQNLVILGDVTDISRQRGLNTFYVQDGRNALDEVRLRYVPECFNQDVGVLDINLNGKRVFSGVPDCGTVNRINLDPDLVVSGVNDVTFTTNKGSYIVDRILVTTELKEKQYPTYYFNIDEDDWDDIDSNKYFANLTMRFLVPDDHYTDIKVNINGDFVGVYTRDEEYTRNIDEFLREDNNVIRLEPEEVVDILELKVEIERED